MNERYDIDAWDEVLVERQEDLVSITNGYDPRLILDKTQAKRMINALQIFINDECPECKAHNYTPLSKAPLAAKQGYCHSCACFVAVGVIDKEENKGKEQ